MSAIVTVDGAGHVLIAVKAVPGASRDEIAGTLGDRLKIRISAPPEGGKANKAICELIAGALHLKKNQVRIASGASRAEKTIEVDGVDAAHVRKALSL